MDGFFDLIQDLMVMLYSPKGPLNLTFPWVYDAGWTQKFMDSFRQLRWSIEYNRILSINNYYGLIQINNGYIDYFLYLY